MNWKRIGRTLMAFLIVCCLLVNCSPIKAKASATAAGALIAGSACGPAGIFATLFAMGMGVVFVDLTIEKIKAMGDSMSAYLYQWGTSAEQLEEVESFLTLLPPGSGDDGNDEDEGGDGNDDGNDNPKSGFWTISSMILTGLIGWVSSLINGDGIEVEGPESVTPEGYAYYNGLLFQDVESLNYADNYPYKTILVVDGQYCLLFSKGQYHIYSTTSGLRFSIFTSEPSGSRQYIYSNDLWNKNGSLTDGNYFVNYTVDDYFYVIWSSYDVLYDDGSVYFPGSNPTSSITTIVTPSIYVGDIPQQIEDGSFEEDKFELPYINYDQIFQGQADIVDALNNVATQLQDQTMTYEQFMELIQPIPEDDSDLLPEEFPDIQPDAGQDNLANTNANTFLDNLVDIITAPFKWIWGNIKSFFEPLKDNVKDIADAVKALPQSIADGIKEIFIPSEDYLTEKVEALRAEFSFADSVIETFEMFGASLFDVDTSPPVIYIDLGAAEGSYSYGGKIAFIDLHWYERYKPTVDILLSAFMWIVFIWRVGVHLPNIIRGAAGEVPGSITPNNTETHLTIQR